MSEPDLHGYPYGGIDHAEEVPHGWGPVRAQFLCGPAFDAGFIVVRGVPEDPACRDMEPGDRGPGMLRLCEARALHNVLTLALSDADVHLVETAMAETAAATDGRALRLGVKP